MKAELACGKTGLAFDLPDNVHIDVIEPRFVPGIKDPMSAISHALQNPVKHSSLKEMTDPDTYIAIVFSDITRATPYHTILPPLLKELNHIPDSHIRFFCAAGTHREASKEELTGILGRDIVERFRIIQNNSADKSLFRLIILALRLTGLLRKRALP